MIKVKARSGESLEGLLRRFKKMCEKEGLTKEIKRTSYYEKPSERRRRRLRQQSRRGARSAVFGEELEAQHDGIVIARAIAEHRVAVHDLALERALVDVDF